MKKYIEINWYSTLKVEATNTPNTFYIVVTSMWEEIQLRLDEKGFYRNMITKADRLKLNADIEELKEGEFKLEGLATRTPEQTEELRKRQEELEQKYMTRYEYIVDWLNAIELYDKYHSLLLEDEEVWFSSIDEEIK